jgi:hypothetical protein
MFKYRLSIKFTFDATEQKEMKYYYKGNRWQSVKLEVNLFSYGFPTVQII